jgi:predicted DCC family thiol-disulfide oxidoreductase YuxK
MPDASPTQAGAAGLHPVIVFDGVCVLCNGWVRFLLRHDRAGRYRYAAMQSAAGSRLLAEHGLDPQDPASFLLLDGDQAWTDSDAIRRVLAGLGGAWRAAHLLRLLPRRWRDAGYRVLARNRYRWFGRYERCTVPPAHMRDRFLD